MANPNPDPDETGVPAASSASGAVGGPQVEKALANVGSSEDEDGDGHDRIEAGIEELRERVREAQENIRAIADEVMGDAPSDPVESLGETLKELIERQPFTAVALAALVGFVVGSMRSRA